MAVFSSRDAYSVPTRLTQRRRRTWAGVALLSLMGTLAVPTASAGDPASRERSLQREIAAENAQIQAYRGHLSDLRARIRGIESSLAIERSELVAIETNLVSARTRLMRLRRDWVVGRQLLARQLRAQYESPDPDIVGVAIDAQGFRDLLERVSQVQAVSRANAHVVALARREKAAVAKQTATLAAEAVRQSRVTAAVAIERDQVVVTEIVILRREQAALGERSGKQAELQTIRNRLAILAARAAAAQRAAAAAAQSTSSAATGGAVLPSTGGGGFFPAPGTNYTFGEEPVIAARLGALGKALGLHLIGLSGYRSPQHSVEVGGFADDPHTRGEASDTPGVEGVAEQTLLRFGLTRPFAGAAEADHIQLS